jgi:hypothetical protein
MNNDSLIDKILKSQILNSQIQSIFQNYKNSIKNDINNIILQDTLKLIKYY